MGIDSQPFSSKRHALAFVVLAVLTSATVPLGVWLSGGGEAPGEAVFWAFGICAVAVATAFKQFPLRKVERKLPPRELFRCAAEMVGLRGAPVEVVFWVLVLTPVASVVVAIAT